MSRIPVPANVGMHPGCLNWLGEVGALPVDEQDPIATQILDSFADEDEPFPGHTKFPEALL